jgi:hypothetical protein
LACYDLYMDTNTDYDKGHADGLADLEPAEHEGDYFRGWIDGNELHFERRARARRRQAWFAPPDA